MLYNDENNNNATKNNSFIPLRIQFYEDALADLSAISSECVATMDNDVISTRNVYKNAYLLHVCNEMDELVTDMYEKMTCLKNLLLAENIAHNEIDYERLVNEKIEETRKQREFMQVLSPYILLHTMTNNS
jgi:hypothetical protein